MRALDLDRRIDFVKPKLVPIGLGETKEDGWEIVASRDALFSPVSDAEKIRAAAVERKADARFTVRHSAFLVALNGDHKIKFEGAQWEITGVKEIGRREWLEFSAWKAS